MVPLTLIPQQGAKMMRPDRDQDGHLSHDLLIFGGFHKLGSPNSWLVYFMENPKTDDFGAPL